MSSIQAQGTGAADLDPSLLAAQQSGTIGVLAVMDAYRLTGPAKQFLAAAQDLTGARMRFTLAIFQRSDGPTPPLLVAARRTGMPVRIIRERFPGDPRTLLAFVRLAAEADTDLLQTHGYKPNVLASLLPARHRRPWLAFLHGETRENLKVRAYFALERMAVRRADHIVVVSHQMARELRARGILPAKLRVIHNACLAEVTGDEPVAWRAEAPPIVGVVGRLSPEKGVDVALRAHRRVVQRCSQARLWVIGEGPERALLMRLAEKLKIGSSVEWWGYREDMSQLYRHMSVLLIPSRNEGLPNVALEAMAHGIPVVATAVGGVPEVVAGGRTGYMAPAENAEGLAAHLLDLLGDASLRRRLGQAARDEVLARFSLDARCQDLMRLYAEVRR